MIKKEKDVKQNILHRLKIARGHLNKVIEMVETDEYCIDIIHQSQAVQKALHEADLVTLEYHLNTCALDHIKSGEADKAITEIMKVLKQSK
jgi:DNA-binding FrmR family transcriptional regulator